MRTRPNKFMRHLQRLVRKHGNAGGYTDVMLEDFWAPKIKSIVLAEVFERRFSFAEVEDQEKAIIAMVLGMTLDQLQTLADAWEAEDER